MPSKGIMKPFAQRSAPPRQRNPRRATDGPRALLGGIVRYQVRKVRARAEFMAKARKAIKFNARKDRGKLYR